MLCRSYEPYADTDYNVQTYQGTVLTTMDVARRFLGHATRPDDS